MAAQNATATAETGILSRWRRDYRLSLALLVTGIVVVAGVSVFSIWANSTGNYPTSAGGGFATYLLGTAGGILTIVGGIFAFHNWSLLRQGRRIT